MRIPILTYHSMNIHGNDCASNDHVAFAEDLKLISALGLRVQPLHELVDLWLVDPASLGDLKVVALTCDDGPNFDYHDLAHPAHGMQRSMLNILRDFQREHGSSQPGLHMTAFAVVGPDMRRALDSTCMLGRNWWTDDWWADAVATGILGIGNHSWDHNHDSLDHERPFAAPRGSFHVIDNAEAAEYEILQADAYLSRVAPNPSRSLFAYPYGQSNAYLAEEFFPALAGRFSAAFTGDPGYWSHDSDRWRLPRFVCGFNWKSPEQLAAILTGRFAG